MGIYADGIGGYTTTEGTGPLTVTANKTGYRAISSLTDGDLVVITTRSSTGFETALCTKGTSGSNATLTRTQIYMNHSGTTAPVNWSAGEKEIHCTVSAVVLPSLVSENIWTANQLFRQKRIVLDIDDDTYIVATVDDVVSFFVGGFELMRLAGGSPAKIDFRYADANATAGPVVRLFRNSPSPAANDYIGEFDFLGNNSSGAEVAYAWMAARIISATAGSEEGQFDFFTTLSGASVNPFSFRGDRVLVWPDVHSSTKTLLVGKTSQGLDQVGVEARSDGLAAYTVDNNTVMLLNRLNGDGGLVGFFRDSVPVGSITVASGVVSYGAFVAHHPSAREDGVEEPYPRGTVVCATNTPVPGDQYGYLPQHRISTVASDPAVYGVAAGAKTEEGHHIIYAVGVWCAFVIGSVRIGDYVETSDIEGVAQNQNSDIATSRTLGRVVKADNEVGIRLVTIEFGG